MTKDKSISYADSGVSLDAAQKVVSAYKSSTEKTNTPGVVSEIGGFGALFSMSKAGFSPDAYLVSGTDGVGTKLELAAALNIHNTIGQDLVAMCVNDIAVMGARPVFFLDYLATGKLDVNQASEIVGGIADACKIANCALMGGETAEMPGFYANSRYDLAGFCVGGVEPTDLISPKKIKGEEVLVGFASSGFHSNGYSLIRKILDEKNIDLDAPFEKGKTVGQTLLEPTYIYVELVQTLMKEVEINGLAHITGGGFDENIPRILPENVGAIVDTSSWPVPPICKFICDAGNVTPHERYKTFNMGIGLVGAFDKDDVAKAISISEQLGFPAYNIGHLRTSDSGCEVVIA